MLHHMFCLFLDRMQQMPGAHGPDALGFPQHAFGQVQAQACVLLCFHL